MARKPALNEISSQGLATATRSSAVYEKLRMDIEHGDLPPGSKLRLEAMSKRYDVGVSPLREALSRLSAEGLVDRTDLRGFSVAPLNWDELPILTKTRVQIESIALRESIENLDAAMEDELVLIVHRLSRTPRSLSTDHFVTNPDWETYHRQFHVALLARCPSRWLRQCCDNLAGDAYRYRQVAANKSFDSREVHHEHLAIFEATIERRADDAVRLLTDHYLRTNEVVSDQARQQAHAASAEASDAS